MFLIRYKYIVIVVLVCLLDFEKVYCMNKVKKIPKQNNRLLVLDRWKQTDLKNNVANIDLEKLNEHVKLNSSKGTSKIVAHKHHRKKSNLMNSNCFNGKESRFFKRNGTFQTNRVKRCRNAPLTRSSNSKHKNKLYRGIHFQNKLTSLDKRNTLNKKLSPIHLSKYPKNNFKKQIWTPLQPRNNSQGFSEVLSQKQNAKNGPKMTHDLKPFNHALRKVKAKQFRKKHVHGITIRKKLISRNADEHIELPSYAKSIIENIIDVSNHSESLNLSAFSTSALTVFPNESQTIRPTEDSTGTHQKSNWILLIKNRQAIMDNVSDVSENVSFLHINETGNRNYYDFNDDNEVIFINVLNDKKLVREKKDFLKADALQFSKNRNQTYFLSIFMLVLGITILVVTVLCFTHAFIDKYELYDEYGVFSARQICNCPLKVAGVASLMFKSAFRMKNSYGVKNDLNTEKSRSQFCDDIPESLTDVNKEKLSKTQVNQDEFIQETSNMEYSPKDQFIFIPEDPTFPKLERKGTGFFKFNAGENTKKIGDNVVYEQKHGTCILGGKANTLQLRTKSDSQMPRDKNKYHTNEPFMLPNDSSKLQRITRQVSDSSVDYLSIRKNSNPSLLSIKRETSYDDNQFFIPIPSLPTVESDSGDHSDDEHDTDETAEY